MKKVIITILLLMNINLIYSQSVVINEYYNSQNVNEEWVELLVVQDVVSLVDFTLLDGLNENGEVSKWAGGIQFIDNILWKNLRQGTVIVINFRNNQISDKNKSDGFIMVNADDENYFLKISNFGNWEDVALNVDNNCDVFQLRNNQGIVEHTIGHTRNREDLKIDLQGPFLISSNSCMINSVIAVLPGEKISDYDGGFDDNKIKLITEPEFISKGLPNKNPLFYNTNGNFWKSLRQPNWDNPTLTANIRDNYVDLFWNSCSDNFPSDMTIGYLIVRYNINDIDSVEHPNDGTTYQKGDLLGKAIVINNDPNSLTTSYSDNFSFDCNDVFRYRIYAYRFETDNLLGNRIDESYKRGRIYNIENYAEVLVSKKRPILPKIIVVGDTSFCEGDSVKLICDAPGGPFKYTWFLNNVVIPNANKMEYYANKAGLYKVRITNEKGCYNESREIQLIQLPTPHSELKFDSTLITQDTIIQVCKGEAIVLSISGGDRYEWFKNDTLLNNNTDKLKLIEEGEYFGVAINNGMECSDTTYKIVFEQLDIDFSFDKDTIYYYLDKNTSFEDKILKVENFGSDTLKFIDIILPPGGIFSVFATIPSLVVNPKSFKDYKIRFEPDRSGYFLDSISFIAPCLNTERKVYINAYKEPLDIALKPKMLKFPDKIDCEKSTDTLNFKIINNEDKTFALNKPYISNNFIFVTDNFPYTINSKDSIELKIAFISNIPGIIDEDLELNLINEIGVKEKLYLKLQGVVKKVDYSILYNDSNFTEIRMKELTGCDDTSYAQIKVINTGEVALSLGDNSHHPEIYFPDLPLQLEPGEEKTLQVLFIPENQGTFDQQIDLLIEPCSYIKRIRILGNKNGLTYKINQNKVDFGLILNCKDSVPVTQNNKIIVSGSSKDSVYIESIIGPNSGAFTTDLVVGKKLIDTNNFQITFLKMPIGIYYDSIEIYFQPCDVKKIIYLYGERMLPEISFSPDTLNFGQVMKGKSDTLSIKIINSGKIDLNLEILQDLNYPFKIIKNFDGLLKSGDTIVIDVAFSPLEDSLYQDLLFINITQPCLITKTVKILGEGIKPKDIVGSMDLGENKYCFPGDEIKIPIVFEVTNDAEINKVNLTSMSFDIVYNYSLLFPIDLEFNGTFTNSEININKFVELYPGKLIIDVEFNDPINIRDGHWFDIKFLVLLGNAMETDISIENLIFHSEVNFNVNTIGTKAIIKEQDNISSKLIDYNNFNVNLEKPIVNEDNIYFDVNSEENGLYTIEIYSITGELIKSIKIHLKSGINNVSLSLNDINNGIYFLKIKNSSFSKFFKILKIN